MDSPPLRLDDGRAASLSLAVGGSMTQPKPRYRRRHMKRTRSAPDCKHGLSKIKIGVCAMDKKAQSKPMREILARLTAFGEFEIVMFGDEIILNRPAAEWPVCDVMLSWHSDGFPLARAKEYVAHRRPFLINDIHMQELLLDRRKVYSTLMANGIPVPRHIIVSRELSASGEPSADPEGFVEGEDYVELNGVRIDKPFVEKPTSGEDHNIWVYYPTSMGGGVKRLFRKVNNKSADYDPKHPGTVRRDGSYIYEEFLTTGGTDVKVYTVGPRYAHAEARKSPVVDGKVNRTADGKEVRFPVLLSPQEKEIARLVCLAFGQRVCGFDLLRSEKAKSYVCDVNGWSFVKNSCKYYDDAAGILRSMVLAQLAPQRLVQHPQPPLQLPLPLYMESEVSEEGGPRNGSSSSAAAGQQPGTLHRDIGSLQDLPAFEAGNASDMEDTSSSGESGSEGTPEPPSPLELRCVLAVIRHGDRTPKQKMKMTVTQAPLIELFNKHKDSKGKQAKLKSPSQLQELLDITRQLLADMDAREAASGPAAAGERDEAVEELREKLRIVRTVLEQGGQFSGINRKVQLKPVTWVAPPTVPATPKGTPAAAAAASGEGGAGDAGGSSGSGPEQKDAKSSKDGKPVPVVKELMLILKYGGVLTHAGRKQAEDLGKTFRMVMYPRYGNAGGGLLRLHSTYRHDLKIYSSDEGRVQMSAAAFTQGLLDLEGNSLTPILVSLVNKNASMLDAFGKGASEDILAAKNTLYQYLTWDPEKSTSLCSKLAQPLATPVITSPPMSPRQDGAHWSGLGRQHEIASSASGVPRMPRSSRDTRSREQSPMRLPSLATRMSSGNLPVSSSCVDLLAKSMAATNAATPSNNNPPSSSGNASSNSSSSGLSGQNNGGPFAAGRQQGHLPPTAAASAAAVSAAAASALPPLANANSSGSQKEGGGGGGSERPRLQVQVSSSSSSTAVSTGLAELQQSQQATRASAVSHIRGMPEKPLLLLHRLVELMKVLVDQLRSKCLEERLDVTAQGPPPYSSLSMAPEEWALEQGRPCSGERLLLVFDRWRKLLKSFYNEKKQQFDISKIPDIYDSAKYDAIHNSHLQLTCLKELYAASRTLAAVVVPHEYGLDPPSKLRIGAKICCELLAKLLADLDTTKEESIMTAAIEARQAALREEAERSLATTKAKGPSASHLHGVPSPYDCFDAELGSLSLRDELVRPIRPGLLAAAGVGGPNGGSNSDSALDELPAAGEGDAADAEPEPSVETVHRLCPTYASDINSPLRHVRTRIYFTSESHIHSLINVLRYCHLKQQHRASGTAPLSHAPSSSMPPQPGSAPGSHSSSTSNVAGLVEGQGGSHQASPAASGGAAAAADGSRWPNETAAATTTSSNRRTSSSHQPTQADAGAAAGSGGGGGGGSSSGGGTWLPALVCLQGQDLLTEIDECDYLTHIVFRMYEDKRVPLDAPERFLIEVLFSNGANYDPTGDLLHCQHHTLPTIPRTNLVDGQGVTLSRMVDLLSHYAGDCGKPGGSAGGEPQASGRPLCSTPSVGPNCQVPSRFPSCALNALPPHLLGGFTAASAGSVSMPVSAAVVAAAVSAVAVGDRAAAAVAVAADVQAL